MPTRTGRRIAMARSLGVSGLTTTLMWLGRSNVGQDWWWAAGERIRIMPARKKRFTGLRPEDLRALLTLSAATPTAIPFVRRESNTFVLRSTVTGA